MMRPQSIVRQMYPTRRQSRNIPSLHGNWYPARSMATTRGTSRSFIGRISSAAGSASCLTLDTREDPACEFQIVPGLALFAWATQQVGGMIGHDERPTSRAEMVDAL